MDTGLRDKVAVVTGASGGIGSATAAAFGGEGARVALTYKGNREGAESVARRIDDESEAMVVPLSLEEPASIESAMSAIADRWGGIDVLVANAVRWPQARADEGRAERLPLSEWRESLRTNLEGTVATVNAALPFMRERNWGRIVLISSSVADEGQPGPNPYGVGKAALWGLARQLAWDVGRDGILVNVVGAGFTVTERNLANFGDEVRESVSSRIPSGRLSSPEEVANLVVFLASRANGNITGEQVLEGSSTGRSAHLM
ncbi:MAG: SDR family NAD(P)-dependent oxidoreductase [Solirubrobacterales bacterium]